LLKHRYPIDLAPAQIYSSALIFSPKNSVVRQTFKTEIKGFSRLPEVPESWSPELLRLEGHTERVVGSSFSFDGRMVASASFDHTIRLWDSTTGTLFHELRGHEDQVFGVVFDKNNPSKLLASWSRDCTVRLWDVSTGSQRKVLRLQAEGGRGVSFLSFSPRNVLACALGKNVILWSEPWAKELETIPFQEEVKIVEFHPTSELLSVVTNYNHLTHWDYPNARSIHGPIRFDGLYDAFSPDGNLLTHRSLATGSIELRDARTSNFIRHLADSHLGGMGRFSANGDLIAACRANEVQVWDAKTGAEVATFKHNAKPCGIAFSCDGRILASCWDNYLTLWDLTQDSKIQSAETNSAFEHCICSEDGSKFAFVGKDNSVTMLDFATAQEVSKLKFDIGELFGQLNGEEAEVLLSPDGRWLLCQQNKDRNTLQATKGEVRIIDLMPSTETIKPRVFTTQAFSWAAFSKDGRLLAVATMDKLTILDLADQTSLDWREVYTEEETGAISLAFSHDANSLAIGKGIFAFDNLSWKRRPFISKIKILNLKTLKSQNLEKTYVACRGIAFSANDQRLAAWGYRRENFGPEKLVLYNLTKQKSLRREDVDINTLEFSDTGYFSPDDSCLVTELGAIPLPWNIADGSRTKHIPAIFYRVQWVARDGEDFLWLPQEYNHKEVVNRDRRRVASTQNRLCIIPWRGPPAFFEFSEEL
jgi:WD40 repeat protein